jgi:site-specific DNA-cytosine methylase
MRSIPEVQVTAAVDLDERIAEVYAANFDHPIQTLDLSEVAATAERLKSLGPFEIAQLSSPCVDFSLSGKRVEGDRAWVTVAGVLVAMRLDVPVIVVENVTRMRQSKAWAMAARLLEDAGYTWTSADADAYDCGVPQHRRRMFVVAVRSGGPAAEGALAAWRRKVESLRKKPLARRSVAEALPRVGDFVFFNARGSNEACIRRSSDPLPTLRTNCGWAPKRDTERGVTTWRYRERLADAAPMRKATVLTKSELGVAGGFDPAFAWPESRRLAAKVIGNSVAPPVAAAVMRALVDAGLLYRGPAAATPATSEESLAEMTKRFDDAVSRAPLPVKPQSGESWERAALAACAEGCGNRRRRPTESVTPHPDALQPPRWRQSEAAGKFRTECRRRGLRVPTAAEEMRAGWGVRDKPDPRPVLRHDSKSAFLDEARERIRHTRMGGKENVARSGLWQPVTGWPSAAVKEWERSGASKMQLEWLTAGYAFDFTDAVPPIGMPGGGDANHPGCADHARWLHEVFAEFLVLGIVSEVNYRPKIVNKMNVIPKGDFDEADPVLRNRLRLLLDQRPLNAYLKPQRFRAETLHKSRGLIEEGDVCLQWDLSSFFYHFATARAHRECMGCTLGAGGPLGGRYFVWNAAPMGVATSPWVSQSLGWVLSKKWKRLGLRVMWYVDDIVVWCKRSEAEDVAKFVEAEFVRHGFLRNPGKSHPEPRLQARVLGIDMDLKDMVFSVPESKKKKTVEELRELVASDGRPVHVRTLAKAIGRIMAMHVAVGDVARRMTREAYSFIAELTGVPPDATRRDLRVAWETWAPLTSEVLEELEFWIEFLPPHEGTEIHPGEQTASVVLSADTGENAWGGFLDLGHGRRLMASAELTEEERKGSSTARELAGHLHTLEAFELQAVRALETLEETLRRAGKELRRRRVILFCDSMAAVRVLEVGSSNLVLHRAAKAVFKMAMRHSLVLVPRWRRRCTFDLQLCDDLGKLDDCDYQLAPRLFSELQKRWRVCHTVDCFASSTNKLTEKFFSKFWCQGTAGVDAFARSWRGEDCWLHPPRCLVGLVVRQLMTSRARGTVLVPLDRSEVWWPLVAAGSRGAVRAPDGVPGESGELRWTLRRRRGLLRSGGAALPPGFRDLVAVRLDFRDTDVSKSYSPRWKQRALDWGNSRAP